MSDTGSDEFLADRHADLDPGEFGSGLTDADYYDRISATVRPAPDPAEPIAEYGRRMTSGTVALFPADPEVERVYPMAQRIEHALEDGGKVVRRRIIVVEDWTEVTGPVDDLAQLD